MEQVYAFDRIVLPAGVEVLGHVTGMDPVPKMVRAQAILGGDVSPLHFARAEFTTVMMPDGRQISIKTLDSAGLPSIYLPPRPSSKKIKPKKAKNTAKKDSGVIDIARQQVKTQLEGQIRGRIQGKTHGLEDLIHGPNRKERLEDLLVKKLPYHPQWYPRGNRFDAVLSQDLEFGTATVPTATLENIGTPPASDAVARVRLLSTLTSTSAQIGDSIGGVLSQPLFSSDNHLILPEGTHIAGRVRQVRRARWFHRSGQLRFAFDQFQPPATAFLPAPAVGRTEAQLASVEADPNRVKVDEEGTAKATESKARFLRPAIAAIIAMRSLDDDPQDHQLSGTGSGDVGGRSAGGFSGLGLAGMAAARASTTVGSVLGFYGLGWSVYRTVISKGPEVGFEKNASMEIPFGSRHSLPKNRLADKLGGVIPR
jgi:hypothetical protein